MSSRQTGPKVISFQSKHLEEYFRNNPQQIEQKRGHELFVACLMSQFLRENGRVHLNIGLLISNPRLTQAELDAVSVEQLINSTEYIEDRDIDVVLGNDQAAYAFQITRLVSASEYPKRKGLKELLTKKFCSPRSNNISLVVSIGEQLRTDLTEVESWVRTQGVPYNSVLLVGKTSPQPGHFTAITIYPAPRLVWRTIFSVPC